MKRLCFLLPDIGSTHGIVDDLRAKGIHDSDIYVVAKESTPLGDLPDAGKIEESDFYPQLARGLAMGGTIGLIGGLIAMRFAGAVFGGGAVLLFGLIGAGVNALFVLGPIVTDIAPGYDHITAAIGGALAATAGAAFPNSRLTQFEDAIEAGSVLVMVNVTEDAVGEIEKLVKRRHPEAEIEGVEPHTPVFPHR